MNKKKKWQRLFSMILVGIMLLGLTVPAFARNAGGNGSGSIRIEQVDNSEVTATAPQRSGRQRIENGISALSLEDGSVDENELIRVSIVLEEPSTIAVGYSTMNIAQNTRAMNYRDSLRQEQESIQNTIERGVLGGKDLDVVWNLTLAANIISAYVPRYAIDEIVELAGVEAVVEEMQYYPDVISIGGELEPNMALAGEMTGSTAVWDSGSGYTGAGTKIAIIDTGLDTDHQSFDEGAFNHAIDTLTDFNKSLLLTADEVAGYLGRLNIADLVSDADDLYLSSKVPFAYNYIDGNFDITHDNDSQGEHGSHVAGIAAANRFVDTDGDKQYEDALEAVLTAGNAPDAQLIIMKVFGNGGGAYDSDYMAAIEDAIVLGADAINLSLGSSMAGFATTATYQDILDSLAESTSVVTMSAGNAGYWAEETTYGCLYSDGVNFATGGSPATYSNSFAVASVDNQGMISETIEVEDARYPFTETSGNNKPISTLTEESYNFIYLDNVGVVTDDKDNVTEDYLDTYKDAIQGKIVFVQRGTSTFILKQQAAEAAGAIACIVVNNQSGTISMDLSDSEATIPCVSITQAAGLEIMEMSTPYLSKETSEAEYYTGTLTINGVSANRDESDYKTMSSFSSWGVPGDLSLKPEITAPGGNIYSVNGAIKGGTAYELMSGTSMAAPQVAGMSALVQQYLRDENIKVSGLNSRALTQALLMSTAEPIIDGESTNYYPVMQQGAGLANVKAAVSTPVYITVNGQEDGKVKAELGDDPDKSGEYKVTFTLHNLKNTAYRYALSADVFTQDAWTYEHISVRDTWTAILEDARVTFDKGPLVEVPASGNVTVTATITLDKNEIEDYDDAGMYVEAYIFAKSQSNDEGALAPTLSIPVLGYYGSWTEPSMYDVSSLAEQYYQIGDTRYPYLWYYQDGYYLDQDQQYWLSTYNYAVDAGDGYLLLGKDTNDLWYTFLSADTGVGDYYYAMIRNAGNGMHQVTDADSGEVYYRSKDSDNEYCAFYYDSGLVWYYTNSTATFNWFGTDKSGKVLEDGTEVNVSVVRAPEYYADENGEYDWDALTDGVLGDGAYLTTTFIMDSTPPVIVGDPTVTKEADNGYTITINTQDTIYVSAVELYANDGDTFYDDAYPDEPTGAFEAVFENVEPDVYYIVVWDYANNRTTYRLFVGIEPTDEVESVTLSETEIELVTHSSRQLYATVLPVTLKDRGVVWSSSDESVAIVDQNGLVTGMDRGTATITAASVMDNSVTATCEVSVYPVNVLLHGVLADAAGNPRFFDYDIGTGELSMGRDVDQYPIAVADVDDATFYLLNTSGRMYLMDKASGKALSGPSDWSDVWTVSNYSEAAEGVFYTYGPYLMGPDDPAEDALWYYWDLSPYGAGYLFSVAVLDEPWEYDFGDDGVYSGDFIVYAIDSNNYVWELPMFWYDAWGSYAFLYGYAPSDLPVEIAGWDNLPYSNMIAGEDGTLYYSMMTGNTNEIYSLVYNEDGDYWESTFLGDVGYNVWPALLLNAQRLRYDFDGNSVVNKDDAQLLLDHIIQGAELIDCAADADVDVDGDVDTHDVHALLDMLANGEIGQTTSVKLLPNMRKGNAQRMDLKGALDEVEEPEVSQKTEFADESETDGISSEIEDVPPAVSEESETAEETPETDEAPVAVADPAHTGSLNSIEVTTTGNNVVTVTSSTVTVPVVVADSTNGEFTLTYDPDVLTLTKVTETTKALTSVNIDEAQGIIHAGYAAANQISTTVLTAKFSYTATTQTRTTELTLTVTEDSEENGNVTDGYPVESTIDIRLPASATTSTPKPSYPGTSGGGNTRKPGTKEPSNNDTQEPETEGPGSDNTQEPGTGRPDTHVPSVDEFTDVSSRDWFYEAVEQILATGLMRGVGNGKFEPNTPLNRGMLATMLYRLAGEPTVNGASGFNDVVSGIWYSDPVIWAAANNIVDGYGDGTYRPENNISRQELAVMLWRYAQLIGLDIRTDGTTLPDFRDRDQVADWAGEAISWAYRTGIMLGDDNNSLNPTSSATRAEAATMIIRFMNLIAANSPTTE